MTVAVVGFDAADRRLADEFNCENLLLDRSAPLESFAHSRDTPLTAEVWPVIATGQMPSDGGGGKRGSDWSGLLGLIDRAAKTIVPKPTRNTVGRYLRLGQPGSAMFGDTEGDHLFSDGAVLNWPGLTPTRTWKRAEYWLKEYHQGEINDLGFLRRQLAFTGQEVGWVASMSQVGFPIVGVHAHILDHAGHAWALQPDKLREVYQHVDRLVELLLTHDAIDDLVVLSDHGMQTTVTQDEQPGHHSFDGMVAATFGGDLPEHVRDVRSWIESHLEPVEGMGEPWTDRTFDTPVEHLKDLGYMD